MPSRTQPRMIRQSNKVWAQESGRPGLKSHAPLYSLSNLRQVCNFSWAPLSLTAMLEITRILYLGWEVWWDDVNAKHLAHRTTAVVMTNTFISQQMDMETIGWLTHSWQVDWPVFPQSWMGTVEGFWFWTWGGRWFASREGKLAKSRPSWKEIFWGYISQAHKSQPNPRSPRVYLKASLSMATN